MFTPTRVSVEFSFMPHAHRFKNLSRSDSFRLYLMKYLSISGQLVVSTRAKKRKEIAQDLPLSGTTKPIFHTQWKLHHMHLWRRKQIKLSNFTRQIYCCLANISFKPFLASFKSNHNTLVKEYQRSSNFSDTTFHQILGSGTQSSQWLLNISRTKLATYLKINCHQQMLKLIIQLGSTKQLILKRSKLSHQRMENTLHRIVRIS